MARTVSMALPMVSTRITPSAVACTPSHLEAPPSTQQWLVSPRDVVAVVLFRTCELIVPSETNKNPLEVEVASANLALVCADGGLNRSSSLSCERTLGSGPISNAAGTLSAARAEAF